MNKTWKSVEMRIARFFSAERTPLSGGNSGHTRSDSRSKTYFIETKHRAKWAVFELWKNTMMMAKKEKKLPFLCLHEKGKSGFMICVNSRDWEKLIEMEYKRLFVDVHLCDICVHHYYCDEREKCEMENFVNAKEKKIVDCTDFNKKGDDVNEW